MTSTIRDIKADRLINVRAKYVVTADGGRTIGKQLGIAMARQKDLITSSLPRTKVLGKDEVIRSISRCEGAGV